MKISGCSYIRNGFEFGYPFLESIQSILPICDEFIIAVGDSSDGTREAIQKINSPKIKIIDTVWDMNLRKGGQIFAQQSNLALDAAEGDWIFHIQADEVIHEDHLQQIKDAINRWDSSSRVEGLLFPFLHFWGDYRHIRTSRKVHRYEIRAFKNTGHVRSYKDSMGFRKYLSINEYDRGASGEKLRVKKINVPVFHYTCVRPPELMKKKTNYFHRFWHTDAGLQKKISDDFQYAQVDSLSEFQGIHPKVMLKKISEQDWEFEYNPSKTSMKLKDRVLQYIESLTGYRLFEYKNYVLV